MHKGKSVDGWMDVFELSGFKEKPDRKTADKYLQSGEYLWNMGYLVGTLETFEKMFDQYSPDMKQRYEKLVKAKDVNKTYLDLESEAIDYAFSEKVKGAFVLPGTFDWMDVGSFSDLHSVSSRDESENHVRGRKVEILEASNSYINNTSKLPLAVVGVDNVVVVVTENGVLVATRTTRKRLET